MSVFSAMNISATGMTAQRTRLDLISENIANVILQEMLMAMSTKGNPWYLKKKIMYLSMMLL